MGSGFHPLWLVRGKNDFIYVELSIKRPDCGWLFIHIDCDDSVKC